MAFNLLHFGNPSVLFDSNVLFLTGLGITGFEFSGVNGGGEFSIPFESGGDSGSIDEFSVALDGGIDGDGGDFSVPFKGVCDDGEFSLPST